MTKVNDVTPKSRGAGATPLAWRNPACLAGVVGLAVLLVGGFIWWGRPPQMGADEEVFKTVDALFTAVTARDEKLLGQCEQRLHALQGAGKLPAAAADYLDSVLHKARKGSWESAAEKLYAFMREQRREGTREPPKKKESGVRSQGSGVRTPGPNR